MLHIVTISLKNDHFIQRTQNSLRNINCSYKWIIVFPESLRREKIATDNSTILYQYGKGIPNAYNVAVEYLNHNSLENINTVIFINAGDEIISITSDDLLFAEDFCAYKVLAVTEKFNLSRVASPLKYSELCKKQIWTFLTGNPIPHQSTIYKVKCFENRYFDESAKTASDTEFNFRLITDSYVFSTRDKVLSKFYLGGVSSFRMYELFATMKIYFKKNRISITKFENFKVHIILLRRLILAPLKRYL